MQNELEHIIKQLEEKAAGCAIHGDAAAVEIAEYAIEALKGLVINFCE